MALEISLSYLLSYFIGAFPTAYLFVKIIKGEDIRKIGSGNVGATNVLRILGKKWGFTTLFIDMLKGTLALFLTDIILSHLLLDNPQISSSFISNKSWILLGSALIVFLGHLFPVWLNFKGGKGAATAAGIFLYLTPLEMTLTLGCFILIVSLFRYVSLGSIISATLFPIFVYINLTAKAWEHQQPFFIITAIFGATIILMHIKNIKRLASGTESKIFSSSTKSKQNNKE